MLYGYAITILLLLLALAGITLEKAYFYLPLIELQRRAAKGDQLADALARASQYGDELRLLLVVPSWLLASVGLVLLVRLTPLAIGIAGAVATLTLLFFWQVRSPLSAQGAKLAAICSPLMTWKLKHLHRWLRRPAQLFGRFHLHRVHTGLYERADFRQLLERQRRQRDNRIDVGELHQLQRLLSVDTHVVGELMQPRSQVMAVNAKDQISPVFINELHNSGQALFPVYEGIKTDIVGVLRLKDVADLKHHGPVAAVADPHLAYLNQDDPLIRAVQAYCDTHQELFVVVDAKAKYIGILTLQNLLQYLFGGLDGRPAGYFEDPAAVARGEQR